MQYSTEFAEIKWPISCSCLLNAGKYLVFARSDAIAVALIIYLRRSHVETAILKKCINCSKVGIQDYKS